MAVVLKDLKLRRGRGEWVICLASYDGSVELA